MSVLGQSLNLLSSILTILLTCPNSNTLLCYHNDPVLNSVATLESRVLTVVAVFRKHL